MSKGDGGGNSQSHKAVLAARGNRELVFGAVAGVVVGVFAMQT